MITNITLALRDWLHTTLKIPVILANKNDPRPPKPYGVIQFISSPIVKQDEISMIDDDGKIKIKGLRSSFYSIEVVGNNCFDLLELARTDLRSPSTFEHLRYNHSISISGIGPVNDITSLLETSFEPRAQMDLMITYANEIEKDAEWIEKIEINGKIINIMED